jgi:hypothetical protein
VASGRDSSHFLKDSFLSRARRAAHKLADPCLGTPSRGQRNWPWGLGKKEQKGVKNNAVSCLVRQMQVWRQPSG